MNRSERLSIVSFCDLEKTISLTERSVVILQKQRLKGHCKCTKLPSHKKLLKSPENKIMCIVISTLQEATVLTKLENQSVNIEE